MKVKNHNLKVIQRSNKLINALELPVIMNLNPRSVYNKIDEFHTFVEQEEVDIVLMSESWERQNLNLDQIVHLENHRVISNVHQRIGGGGRPAIIANIRKYDVEDITNTLVNVKWGVEAVWCLLTPKNSTRSSKIQKIACAAIYSKPGSKQKSDLLDHISEAYSILSAKFGKGLQFCIAGDTNELNLSPILSLSPNMVQIVQEPTRIDPKTGVKKILDPIIMSFSQYYQKPTILEPLDKDFDKIGEKSDHRIVLVRPIRVIDNDSARLTKTVKIRPLHKSGMVKMKTWLMDQSWTEVYEAETAHKKASVFQNLLVDQFDRFFPEKQKKISSDDAPWMTTKLKKLDRKRKGVYHKQRKSEKWYQLDKDFKNAVKAEKKNFYKTMIADLKNKKPAQ